MRNWHFCLNLTTVRAHKSHQTHASPSLSMPAAPLPLPPPPPPTTDLSLPQSTTEASTFHITYTRSNFLTASLMHSKGINKTKNISKMKAIHSFHKCMVGGETSVQTYKEAECSPIFHSQPSLPQKAASVLSQWCCNWPELPTSLSTDLQTKHSCITYNTVSKITFGKSVHKPLVGHKSKLCTAHLVSTEHFTIPVLSLSLSLFRIPMLHWRHS